MNTPESTENNLDSLIFEFCWVNISKLLDFLPILFSWPCRALKMFLLSSVEFWITLKNSIPHLCLPSLADDLNICKYWLKKVKLQFSIKQGVVSICDLIKHSSSSWLNKEYVQFLIELWYIFNFWSIEVFWSAAGAWLTCNF